MFTLKHTIYAAFLILLATACFCGIMAFDQMLAQIQAKQLPPVVIHEAKYVEIIKGRLIIDKVEEGEVDDIKY